MKNITTPLNRGNLSVASQVCELMLFRFFSRSVGYGLGWGCYARSSFPSSVSKSTSSANFFRSPQLLSLAGPPFPRCLGWAREAGSAVTGCASAAEGGGREGGRRRWRRGLRRAVAGAERGGRGAGTRLAPLAASARISVPQPCASPALVSRAPRPQARRRRRAVSHRIWSRAEKLLCLCSLVTHWKLYSDIFWDLVWSVQTGG